MKKTYLNKYGDGYHGNRKYDEKGFCLHRHCTSCGEVWACADCGKLF